jgi:dCTP deaminase
LSDRSIREALASGGLGIEPFDPELVQPASVDLRLARTFLAFRTTSGRVSIDPKQPAEELMETVEVGPGEPLLLYPRQFVLGSTVERVRIPDDLVARLEGRSSLGRLGIIIHSTAGVVDPGWDGHLTLEISNLAPLAVALYPGMRIAQLSLMRLDSPAEVPYGPARGSKYQGDVLPTASRLYRDFA